MKKLKGQPEQVIREAYRKTEWVRKDIKSIIDGQAEGHGNDDYKKFTEEDRENYFVEEVQMWMGIYDDNMLSEDGLVLTIDESNEILGAK